jgi:hypothetical protein
MSTVPSDLSLIADVIQYPSRRPEMTMAAGTKAQLRQLDLCMPGVGPAEPKC